MSTTQSKRSRAHKAREAAELAFAIQCARVPGAVWTDTPLSRCHLPGIPYSYYDEEIVMIRERTAALIARQRAEAEAFARMRRRQKQQQQEDEGWHEVQRSWSGVDDE
jgi:hypothetical protein